MECHWPWVWPISYLDFQAPLVSIKFLRLPEGEGVGVLDFDQRALCAQRLRSRAWQLEYERGRCPARRKVQGQQPPSVRGWCRHRAGGGVHPELARVYQSGSSGVVVKEDACEA